MTDNKNSYDKNETADAVVSTVEGKVKGYLNSDKGIYTFKGLHYGESTAGTGRFRPPQRVKPWEGIRDATAYGHSSPQPRAAVTEPPDDPLMAEPVEQSEDCLVLNVWTPGLEGKRPVMVWLHGGGFASGSGSGALYEGTSLSKRGDVVVVTVNHRLNVFGYLHLEEVGGEYFTGSGVAGMLDIVLALEWVRDNIGFFGGDPGNVTIFGESGGGAKVSALLAMPCAKGLFHKGIMESGAGLNGTLPEAGTKTAKALMKKLSITDPRKLQELPAEDLQKALALEPGAPRMGGPMGFSPVVDGQYLPAHPFDPAAPPTAAGIPIMIGTNRDEMLFMMLADPKRKKLSEEELIERITPRTREKTEEILATYRKSRPDASPWDLLIAIISEPFRRRSIALAERKVAASNDPVYMYLFEFEVNSALKAAHFMEVPFVFSNTHLMRYFRRPETKDVESQISEAWIAFARTGNPNHPGLPEWTPYTADTRATMIFDANSRIVNDPRREERLSWEGLDMAMAMVP